MKRHTLVSSIVLASLTTAAVASATVHREGEWPDAEKVVTVDVSGAPRAEAIRKLAEAAGWSVVVQAPPGDPVDIHVKGQPAAKVLELLLMDADYVAKRDGTLIDIHRTSTTSAAQAVPAALPSPVPPMPPVGAIPPAPPVPPAPPAPPAAAVADHGGVDAGLDPETAKAAAKAKREARGDDRVVTGGSLRVEKGETVHDVAVFGGSVDVYGTVTGDIAVMGGSARLHKGAKVEGDATAIGGTLRIEDGAEVEGDAAVVGGALLRDDGAQIGGKTVTSKVHGSTVQISAGDDDGDHHGDHGRGIKLQSVGHSISSALTSSALLFVFGAVLLALGARKMETLQAEIASRPMRTFALGVVGALAAIAALIAMCVTIIGIPFAAVLAVVGVFATYAGLAAVLTTAGGALLAHRTKSPYLHLAAGCAIYLVATAIPFVGGIIGTVATVMGVGVLVATRAAGMVSGNSSQGPYRTV